MQNGTEEIQIVEHFLSLQQLMAHAFSVPATQYPSTHICVLIDLIRIISPQ